MSPAPTYSDQQLEAAIAKLSEPGRMRAVESSVAAAAPRLQGVLAQALEDGGWFAESHEQEVTKIADIPDEGERLTALRTLLAEETRIGMMVGVAVGWALAQELGELGEPGELAEPGALEMNETENETEE